MALSNIALRVLTEASHHPLQLATPPSTALAEKSFPVILPWFCGIGTKWLSH
jgi:hypothetical protein